jgi:hypothetical protein
MNREQRIETAARALYAEYRRQHPGTLTWGTEPDYFKRERFYPSATVVLDAIEPQVTTVEELEALPVGTVLVTGRGLAITISDLPIANPDVRGYRGMHFATRNADDALLDGPLTVVWQP